MALPMETSDRGKALPYDRDSVDHVLTTTRSVRRRLDFDRPVERAVIEECVEIAIQAAPGGGEARPWHFVVVTDAARREAIGELYRAGFRRFAGQAEEGGRRPMRPVIAHLAENLHRCPALIIPCIEGRVEREGQGAQAGLYGQILPAAWSLMLALRTRGLGTAWTAIHLQHAEEVAALLDIPDTISQAALFPVAYFTGEDNFRRVERPPAAEVIHWDRWRSPRPSR